MTDDIAAADEAYSPFSPFREWSRLGVDIDRWDSLTSELLALKDTEAGNFTRALAVVRRAAAVQTGAVEGLYEADRGFTITVATQSALVGQMPTGDRRTAMIEDQLRAYEHVLDFATQRVPVAEAWIRKLHEDLCRSQETYDVQTPQGPQAHELPLGAYKSMPNHVRLEDDSTHSYSPVDATSPEMSRLVSELGTKAFASAHPLLQASYAHYALAAIHPFADGNGRVARALGSVYTCRSSSIPLSVWCDDRPRYYSALKMADEGNPQGFVDFLFVCFVDAVWLAQDSFRHAATPLLSDSVQDLRQLYLTTGGYTHAEVDRAAQRLMLDFTDAWNLVTAGSLKSEELELTTSSATSAYGVSSATFRRPVTPPGIALTAKVSSLPPA